MPPVNYQYDSNGNLIRKEKDDKTWTYCYDYENRLIEVVKEEDDEKKIISFKYNPFGRRIEKRVEEIEEGAVEETKTYTYIYDNEDIILEYLTKTKTKKGKTKTKTETTRYIHGIGIDEPLAIQRKGKTYYYHADGLGSIIALTDHKQKVVKSYEYDSFGNMKRKGGKVKNTSTYTGREWDKEIELYYYRARYYDRRSEVVNGFETPTGLI